MLKKLLLKLRLIKPCTPILNSKEKIEEAKKKVQLKLQMFTQAADELEEANLELDEVIGEEETNITRYLQRIDDANNTKEVAQKELQKNVKIITKIQDFLCIDD